jgi:hypothetical protein
LPEADTHAVLQDVTAYWRQVQAPRRRRIRCRICGREVTLSHAQSTRAFDEASQDWVHSTCAGRVSVECPDCNTQRTMMRSLFERLVSKKTTHDGRFQALCRTCHSRRRMRELQLEREETAIGERIAWLRLHGGPETKADRLLRDWLLENQDQHHHAAQFLARHHDREPNRSLVKALLGDVLLRRVGGGNVERGRQLIKKAAPVRARQTARGPSPTKARAHVVRGQLSGVFSLCPLCGLLVYRKNASVERFGRGWHPPCLAAWRGLPAYRAWTAQRLSAQRRGVDSRLVADFPSPPALQPRGRPVSSDDLAREYRTLTSLMGGLSIAQIALDERVSRQAIQQRRDNIRERLPASWQMVFGKSAKGVATRQDLWPLPKVYDGQRVAAQRMVDLGVQADVIEQVTGVRV